MLMRGVFRHEINKDASRSELYSCVHYYVINEWVTEKCFFHTKDKAGILNHFLQFNPIEIPFH